MVTLTSEDAKAIRDTNRVTDPAEIVDLLSEVEVFAEEYRRVCSNLADPKATDAERRVTLVLRIKPDAENETLHARIEASSKLAPLSTREKDADLNVGQLRLEFS